eukprot:m.260071 g.260071  ORF g.260071 m.260071 type:complete len:421 (-) comp23253_c0_seq1:104-1366(-)
MVALLTIVIALAATALAQYLPLWAPTWDMQESTIIMPCNKSGLLEPVEFFAQFGVVDIDWSNGKALWVRPPMDCEELLLKQAALIRAVNPKTKVFVYRNLVKALPWYSSVRDKAADPAYAGWFLHFKEGGSFPNGSYHVSPCDHNYNPPLCTDLYHDQWQSPGYPTGDGNCPGPCDCGSIPCGEYLWDLRNASLRDWLVKDFVLGPNALGNENVSGLYLDDYWVNTTQPIEPYQPPQGYCDHSPIGGPSEEDLFCVEDMGLTQADTTDLKLNWQALTAVVKEAVIAANGFTWSSFHHYGTPAKDKCASTLRSLCQAGNQSLVYQSATMFEYTDARSYPLPAFEQDLATFLLVRGPYAWLGYDWVGCNTTYEFRPELTKDYGTPLGTCAETAAGSGVFTREYSKATVQMDCNTWMGSVAMV